MKKQALLRGLMGFPLGVAIDYGITIVISLLFGQGAYWPCPPELTLMMGSQIHAVLLQAALCGLLGAVFAACSVVWEVESWSIVKQTGVYFFITALAMLPIAYAANWMRHTLGGFLIYFGVFVLIFAAVWLIQYAVWKRRIKRMNGKLGAK